MIKRLEDVTNCHICGSSDLMPMTGIMIEDIMTNEDIKRDVLFCTECETMHYIDAGTLAYEFSYKIGATIGPKVRK